MKIRPLAVAGATFLAVAALSLSACSDSGSSSSSSTTAQSGVGGNVTAPVILTPSQTSTTVKVGQVVTFDMGDPAGGRFVATSDKPSVFEVTGEGKQEGSATFNAGGKAVGAGVAEVVVQFRGATNGLGTPTTFTITVE